MIIVLSFIIFSSYLINFAILDIPTLFTKMAISKLKIYFFVFSSKKLGSKDCAKSLTIISVLTFLLIYFNSFATPSNFSLLRAIKQMLNPYLHKSIQNCFPIPSDAPYDI